MLLVTETLVEFPSFMVTKADPTFPWKSWEKSENRETLPISSIIVTFNELVGVSMGVTIISSVKITESLEIVILLNKSSIDSLLPSIIT